MMSVEAERAALCAPFDREIAHPQQGAGVERDRLTAFEDRGDDVRRKEAEPGRIEEDGHALLADDDARAKVAEERAQRCAIIGKCGQPAAAWRKGLIGYQARSEEHTSELLSLMRISYRVLCLKKKNTN